MIGFFFKKPNCFMSERIQIKKLFVKCFILTLHGSEPWTLGTQIPSEQLNNGGVCGGEDTVQNDENQPDGRVNRKNRKRGEKAKKKRKIEFIRHVLSVVRSGRQKRKKIRRLPRNTNMSNIQEEIESKLCDKNQRKKENGGRRRQINAFKQKY